MISTKARYALRVLIDLAEHRSGEFVPMKEVAARQDLSLKYLERILPALVKDKLVEGQHGKGGGYRLTKDPLEYRVLDVLKCVGEELSPVSCLAENALPCPRAAQCKTLKMWTDYQKLTEEYFAGITLYDLVNTESAGEYVI